MEGLAAIAKMLVCVLGLFFVPQLTRKFARELALPVGQQMMNKALSVLAPAAAVGAFMGPKLLSGAMGAASMGGQTSGNLLSHFGKSMGSAVTSSGGGGNPLTSKMGTAFSKLSDKADAFAKNQKLLREAKKHGVTPWSPKKENELQGSFGERKQALEAQKNQWGQFSNHVNQKEKAGGAGYFAGTRKTPAEQFVSQVGTSVGKHIVPRVASALSSVRNLRGSSHALEGASRFDLNQNQPSNSLSLETTIGNLDSGRAIGLDGASAIRLHHHAAGFSTSNLSNQIRDFEGRSRLKRMRKSWQKNRGDT